MKKKKKRKHKDFLNDSLNKPCDAQMVGNIMVPFGQVNTGI